MVVQTLTKKVCKNKAISGLNFVLNSLGFLEIHNARRHTGQNQSAGRMRQLLDFKRFPDENLLRKFGPVSICSSKQLIVTQLFVGRPGDDDAEVQDPYSMRCVHRLDIEQYRLDT